RKSQPPSSTLTAANGTSIHTWGKRKVFLAIGQKGQYQHEFYLADVTRPILGADFFIKHGLAIDLRGKRLLSLDNMSILLRETKSPLTLSGLGFPLKHEYDSLLQKFPELLTPHFHQCNNKHGVEHHIITQGPPTHSRARRLDQAKLSAAKAEFLQMEDMGIIRRSKSAWSSPLHMHNGLVINKAKCIFGAEELDFLGHHVSAIGIIPLPDRVAALRDSKPPQNRTGLQRFLGMINYYHRFLPGQAPILALLHAQASGKGQSIEWSAECQASFDEVKEILARSVLLHHPLPDAPTSLTVDASSTAVGAQLEQRQGQSWVPLAFFSRKLSDAEKKYSAFDRELLASYSAIQSGEMASYRTATTGLILKDIDIGPCTLFCDTSLGVTRPVLPVSWTRPVFNKIHGLSHPGVRPTQKAIAQRFV
ncbi:Pol polyprotein, partial [Plakobranchus ocellatus]